LTIQDWLTINYKDLKQAAKTISGGNELTEDLLHFSIEALLSKDQSVIQDCLNSGGVNFYIVRIMLNSWRSVTSPFYIKYRKRYESNEEIDIVDDQSDAENEEFILNVSTKIQKELDTLDWYSAELFKLHYLEGISISEISRSTKIPRTSISLTLKRTRAYIKNKISI